MIAKYKFTKEVPEVDTTGEKYMRGCLYLSKKEESLLLGNKYMFHWEKDSQRTRLSVSLWETRGLPSNILVTMFKVNKG